MTNGREHRIVQLALDRVVSVGRADAVVRAVAATRPRTASILSRVGGKDTAPDAGDDGVESLLEEVARERVGDLRRRRAAVDEPPDRVDLGHIGMQMADGPVVDRQLQQRAAAAGPWRWARSCRLPWPVL